MTYWVLREWRRKNYIPEPKHRHGRIWFTANQVLLLKKVQELFSVIGRRMGKTKRGSLEQLVAFVHANWE